MDFLKRIFCFALCISPTSACKVKFNRARKAYDDFAGSEDKESAEARLYLRSAIHLYSQVVEFYREIHHENLFASLVGLANAKWDVYELTCMSQEKLDQNSSNILQEVMNLYNEALQTLPNDETGKARRAILLQNLANAHRERYRKLHNDMTDINHAADCYKQALGCYPPTSKEASELEMEIGRTCQLSYSVLSAYTEEDVMKAIQHLEAAYKCGHADIRSECAILLGSAYYDLVKVEKRLDPSKPSAYIHRAIHFCLLALDSMPEDNSEMRATVLVKLAHLHFLRHEDSRKTSSLDLTDAQRFARKALETPFVPNHQVHEFLNNVVHFVPNKSPRGSIMDSDSLVILPNHSHLNGPSSRPSSFAQGTLNVRIPSHTSQSHFSRSPVSFASQSPSSPSGSRHGSHYSTHAR